MKLQRVFFGFFSLILLSIAINVGFCFADSISKKENQHVTSSVVSHEEALLVPVIMVKNEALVIRETLQPYVDAGIQHYLVFDTGSTDDTVAVTKKFFVDNNIAHGVIKQEPFVDFATSRNRAIDLAEEAFPKAVFMVMPDAEWYLQNVEGLLKFCQTHKNAPEAYYGIRIRRTARIVDYSNNRLFRCRTKHRFEGVVHEYLGGGATQVPSDIYFLWQERESGIEKSRRRWVKDLELLQNEYAKNPHDTRTIFYLAQTYACLGDFENAAKYYEERANITNDCWEEETFAARWRYAQMLDKLGNWDKALTEHLKAYAMRPKRAEPLVYIAQHYAKDPVLCYLFARRAAEIPYPADDIGFLEKNLYDFVRYDLLGMSSWYVGDYALGEQAVLEALKSHPHDKHLHNNLALFQKKNNTVKKHTGPKEKTILNVHFRCPDPGGIETHLLILNRLLLKNNIKNGVLTSKHSAFLINQLNKADVRSEGICATWTHDDFYPRTEDFARECSERNVSILVCNSRGHLEQALKVRETQPISIVYVHHFLFNFTKEDIARLNNVQAIITVSPLVSDQLKKMRDNNQLKTPIIEHIPAFFDDSAFVNFVPNRSKENFFKTEFGLTLLGDDPIIAMVANFYPDLVYKNHPLLFEALEILRNRGKKFQLMLAGDGLGRAELEKIVSDKKMTDVVHFLGKTDQIPELLYHADIHVLASAFEGFGIAHLEAAYMKKPFFGASGTGFSPYIKNGVTGFTFKNQDVEDLANKLEILLENPMLCKSMGEHARLFVQQNFSMDVTFNKWLELLAKV